MLSDWFSWFARRRRVTPPVKASHAVIGNDSGEYLIWPSDHSLPSDWHYLGKEGTEEELRTYVQETLAETRPTPLVIGPDRGR
jgi:uncharacterized protein YbdZ (MbtH family)